MADSKDLAERSFYNNMRAYDRYLADLAFAADAFAADAFAADLERIVVEPMFDYNPDLPEVGNIRFADARLGTAARRTPRLRNGSWSSP